MTPKDQRIVKYAIVKDWQQKAANKVVLKSFDDADWAGDDLEEAARFFNLWYATFTAICHRPTTEIGYRSQPEKLTPLQEFDLMNMGLAQTRASLDMINTALCTWQVKPPGHTAFLIFELPRKFAGGL